MRSELCIRLLESGNEVDFCTAGLPDQTLIKFLLPDCNRGLNCPEEILMGAIVIIQQHFNDGRLGSTNSG